MGSNRRALALAVLCLWVLTTGSTCQSTAQSGSFQAQGNGAGVVLVVLAGAAVACLADLEGCGPREPTPLDRVRMTFESGVARLEAGDASGLDWICVAGFQGDARAQYFYGVHLLRQGPDQAAASLAWLNRAAAQGHKAARFVVLQITGKPLGPAAGPVLGPRSVPPPALHACLTGPRPGRPARILEAAGARHDRSG